MKKAAKIGAILIASSILIFLSGGGCRGRGGDEIVVLETTISSQPSNPSDSKDATFQFGCNLPNCEFECQLDSSGFSACTSPLTYTDLSEGTHAFQVRAKDAVGNLDQSPASYTWSIKLHDYWIPNTILRYPPEERHRHTAIWTGTEMIVWGGEDGTFILNSGGRYDPLTDFWVATTTSDAPSAKNRHTAVWTGSEMVVWGGDYDLNTGGRYNPTADSWTATSTTGAPLGRSSHTAVWTGNEMVIWGGFNFSENDLNTGGRYDPATDSWIATTVTNAPAARAHHTAVWTGTKMIVWGGFLWDGSDHYLNTGGIYDPAADSWATISTTDAPAGREYHTAVWTGAEMIIWGGIYRNGAGTEYYLNTGGKYSPASDSWAATAMADAPSARILHTTIWTGTEMIVWGGQNKNVNENTGGRYNPEADSWTATSLSNAPYARSEHTAIWTGTEMIVWGAWGNTGGRYNPSTDSWTETTTTNTPSKRCYHTTVWAGTEMIVWGGSGSGYVNEGGRYNPSSDSWIATSTNNAPPARVFHTSIWTGTEMIAWGGDSGSVINNGYRYNPVTDSWAATSSLNSPPNRACHTAVWTGTEMIVWGGDYWDGSWHYLNTGGRYSPFTDSWNGTTTINAPSGRYFHTAVWTGTEMIIWGGYNPDDSDPFFNTGGRYNPSADSWTETTTTNAPSGREAHTAVWTGSKMIIWGGYFRDDSTHYFNTGGLYNPANDSWMATATTNAPYARCRHTAVWTGKDMIVWGGSDDLTWPNNGGEYNPDADSWTATTRINAPHARMWHAAVWTGAEMIVWGGYYNDGFNHYYNTGGRYVP